MTVINEQELEAKLWELRDCDAELFDRIIRHMQHKIRAPRPLLPNDCPVSAIPRVPEHEVEDFKAKHIDLSEIKDYESAEAKDRSYPASNVRDAQYKRWAWACDNFETYVNMLRVSGHSDENIQAMVDGRPLCFTDKETFDDLIEALKKLKPALEKEHQLESVGFIFTGSSVPGFSQNPFKGRRYEPTRLTCTESSDVDICIKGDGMGRFVQRVRDKKLWNRAYPTTCSPTINATRFGVDWSVLESGALGEFYNVWRKRLSGGLQLTFGESGVELPPWEMPVPIE